MGERKVLNKYIPPDFDPARLPRMRRPEQGKMDVTMMLPMSIQCKTCGNFMYKGTKFNSKKEDVEGETYLGIKIFRLTMKCPRCTARFSLKTDPKNADYIVESGASRNYEPKKEDRLQIDQAHTDRKTEEELNAIRALENRTEDSRRQLELLDELDELRTLRAQHALLDLRPDRLLALRDGQSEPDPSSLLHHHNSPNNTRTASSSSSSSSVTGNEGYSNINNEQDNEDEDALLAHQIFAQKQQEITVKRLKTVDDEQSNTLPGPIPRKITGTIHTGANIHSHPSLSSSKPTKPLSSLPSSLILVKKLPTTTTTNTMNSSTGISSTPSTSIHPSAISETSSVKRSRDEFEDTSTKNLSLSHPPTSITATTSTTSTKPTVGLVSYDSSSSSDEENT